MNFSLTDHLDCVEKTTSTNNHKSQQSELLLWDTASSSEIPALPLSGLSAALHRRGLHAAGEHRMGSSGISAPWKSERKQSLLPHVLQ